MTCWCTERSQIHRPAPIITNARDSNVDVTVLHWLLDLSTYLVNCSNIAQSLRAHPAPQSSPCATPPREQAGRTHAAMFVAHRRSQNTERYTELAIAPPFATKDIF